VSGPRIAALCKYSPDLAEIRIDQRTGAISRGNAPFRFGGVDKQALEAAVRMKARSGGQVEVITLGPPAARDAFKDLLAMGADEATIVDDPTGGSLEPEGAVRVLAETIRNRGPFDVLICGFASDDGYGFQVGPRLAEQLGWPVVPYVREADWGDGGLVLRQEWEQQVHRVEVSPPVVLTVAEEAFPPRRTTLMDALKAKQKPVHELSLADLGLSPEALAALSPVLSRTERGIPVSRGRQRLAGGSAAVVADALIDALIADGILVEADR
jgi:electron transfer flavoprotein beta subunit